VALHQLSCTFQLGARAAQDRRGDLDLSDGRFDIGLGRMAALLQPQQLVSYADGIPLPGVRLGDAGLRRLDLQLRKAGVHRQDRVAGRDDAALIHGQRRDQTFDPRRQLCAVQRDRGPGQQCLGAKQLAFDLVEHDRSRWVFVGQCREREQQQRRRQ
jgi:hypothetical protein